MFTSSDPLADLENLVNLLSDRVVLAQTYVPDAAETLSMVVVGGQVVAAGRLTGRCRQMEDQRE